MKSLDAGSALGAAALVVSSAALLASHAPPMTDVAASHDGSPVAMELRVAELTSGSILLLAGGIGAYAVGAWWPLLVTVAAVGGSIAVYEAALYWQARGRVTRQD